MRIGEEDRAHRGDGREQDDAEAAIGDEHQEAKRRQRNQEIHEPLPSNSVACCADSYAAGKPKQGDPAVIIGLAALVR